MSIIAVSLSIDGGYDSTSMRTIAKEREKLGVSAIRNVFSIIIVKVRFYD